MKRACAGSLLATFLLLFQAIHTPAQKSPRKGNDLAIYSIDVEGGQATLIVSPSGASLLVDTGWPGSNGRDAERIQGAMKDAGISKIDKVLITHFHTDHVGGVPELVKRVKVGEFLDHGSNREDSDITRKDFAAYTAAIGNTPRRALHPGDAIDLTGLNIVVVAADGEHISSVPGIKPEPNSNCSSEPKWKLDDSENPRSVGVLVRFGRFSFLDLGDLTKPKEIDLVCPNNPLGKVSLFLVSHHGLDQSNSKSLIAAIHPQAAIMNNGAHKGGSPEAWQTVSDIVGSGNLFMLHNAEGSDTAHNSPEGLIANPKGEEKGNSFKVVANRDGKFTLTNSRTDETRAFPAK
ncbi:MAG: MBL fold metallo-hydrolase [Acidobacteria bacterium]|nr:MBL fold metallo-hydrolase [Acidobacteriota bacterium]